jgi:hypothetical protein
MFSRLLVSLCATKLSAPLSDNPPGGGGFSIRRGVYVDPPDLCTRAMRTLLANLPAHLRAPGAQPKIIALSSTGIGAAGVAALPALHRAFYPTLLAAPHHDKLGLEVVLAHVARHAGDWVSPSEHTETGILPADWARAAGLPTAGALPEVVLIRAAWLTDGPATGKYRVLEGQGDRKCKTISREDVAHLVAEQIMPQWDEFKGKAIAVAY